MKKTVLGRNLRWFRKAKNLSQSELARHVGLKRNNIASYEAGLVEPRAATFVLLAEFFGVNAGRFLTEDLSRLDSNTKFVDSRNRSFAKTTRSAALDGAVNHQISRQFSRSQQLSKQVRDHLRQQSANPHSSDGRVNIPLNQLTELLDVMEQLTHISTQLLHDRRPSDFE